MRVPSKALAALLLLALFFLLVQAMSSGLAYVNQYRLNATLNRWYENQTPRPENEWVAMEKLALASLEKNESNADIINATGRIYDYRATNMVSDREKQRAYLHKAIGYYRQVIRLRPAWPYGWMNLAISKGRLSEIDGEFKQALLQLLRLGPWEANTLPVIFQLSLPTWPYLDSDTRQPLLNYFIVAQESSRKSEVFQTVLRTGHLKLYCALVTHKGAKASFCP
jgi:hypothetical protein